MMTTIAAIKTIAPIIIKYSDKISKIILPPLKQAISRAVHKTADNIYSKYPGRFGSINFLNMNFTFDSPVVLDELQRIISERENPRIDVIEQELSMQIASQWPDLADLSLDITQIFLKYFEEECLSSPDLSSFALATSISASSSTIQEAIKDEGKNTREYVGEQISEINLKLESLLTRSTESYAPKIKNAFEDLLIQERDDLQNSIKKWQSAGLSEKILALAKRCEDVKVDINPQLAGSIFRLYSSHIIRTTHDLTQAEHWLGLAEDVDPTSLKTKALRAEYLCAQRNYASALDIVKQYEATDEAYIKIIYAECIARTKSSKDAYNWLSSNINLQNNNDLTLNLAIFAFHSGDYDRALQLLDRIKSEEYPGPFPYIYTAHILAKKATPTDFINIGTIEYHELSTDRTVLEEAVRNCQIALELLKSTSLHRKDIANIIYGLAEIYILSGDISTAEHIIKYQWRELRKTTEGWFAISKISLLKNDKHKAISRARRALRIKSDSDSIIHYILMCMNLNEWDEAIIYIDGLDLSSLEKEQEKAVLGIKLSCLFQKEDSASAIILMNKLRTKYPNDPMWLIQYSLYLEKHNMAKVAIKQIKKHRLLLENSLHLKIQLARLYKVINKAAPAMKLYREIAKLTNNPKAFEIACYAALELNDPDTVLTITDEDIHNLKYNDSIFKNLKAYALARLGKYEEAMIIFKDIDESTFNSNDFVFLAACYMYQTKYKQAIELLLRAKQQFPADVRILKNLFLLYIEVDDLMEAFQSASLWLESAPQDRAAYFATMELGFSVGEQHTAHNIMMNYLARFGEGPEFKSYNIEEIKKITELSLKNNDYLWEKYQKDNLPEIFLAQGNKLGVAGTRYILQYSNSGVMAFDGSKEAQRNQIANSMSACNIILDYHALISIVQLNIQDEIFSHFNQITIPEIVIELLHNDKRTLATSFQKNVRDIDEKVFQEIRNGFILLKEVPQINLKDYSDAIGNSAYDLTACKSVSQYYLIPGFENKDSQEIQDEFGITPITILDLIDLFQDKGVISSFQYDDVMRNVAQYRLSRCVGLSEMPKSIMLDWYSLKILKEFDLLELVRKSISDCYVGPFSYFILSNEIDKYKQIDEVKSLVGDIDALIGQMVASKRFNSLPLNLKKDDTRDTSTLYIQELISNCMKIPSLLFTDDFGLSTIAQKTNVKVTSTRAVLEILLASNAISLEKYLNSINQLLRHNMRFTWINSNIITENIRVHNYETNADLDLIIESITSELKKLKNPPSNASEFSNFTVLAIAISNLLENPNDKANKMAMKIFDRIFDLFQKNVILQHYWVYACLLGIYKTHPNNLPIYLKSVNEKANLDINNLLLAILDFYTKNDSANVSYLLRAIEVALPELYNTLNN